MFTEKRCNCSRNQSAHHLRNAGNEVMEKTLREIKLLGLLKRLVPHRMQSLTSPGCGRQPLVIVPLAATQSLLGVFSSHVAVKFVRSLAASKNCPNPLTACPSLISMYSKPPRAATMHTVSNPSKITWILFFMAAAFLSNYSITSEHKVSGRKTRVNNTC